LEIFDPDGHNLGTVQPRNDRGNEKKDDIVNFFLESNNQEIGFCHFKLGNLPKSPSAEHKMSPCSIARAAR
jgi:hypothetical protein